MGVSNLLGGGALAEKIQSLSDIAHYKDSGLQNQKRIFSASAPPPPRPLSLVPHPNFKCLNILLKLSKFLHKDI